MTTYEEICGSRWNNTHEVDMDLSSSIHTQVTCERSSSWSNVPNQTCAKQVQVVLHWNFWGNEGEFQIYETPFLQKMDQMSENKSFFSKMKYDLEDKDIFLNM